MNIKDLINILMKIDENDTKDKYDRNTKDNNSNTNDNNINDTKEKEIKETKEEVDIKSLQDMINNLKQENNVLKEQSLANENRYKEDLLAKDNQIKHLKELSSVDSNPMELTLEQYIIENNGIL